MQDFSLRRKFSQPTYMYIYIYTISQTDREDRLSCMAHGVMSVTIYTCSGGSRLVRDWRRIADPGSSRRNATPGRPVTSPATAIPYILISVPLVDYGEVTLGPTGQSKCGSYSMQKCIHYGTSQSQSTIYSPACVSQNGSKRTNAISTDKVVLAMELTRAKCFRYLVQIFDNSFLKGMNE